MLHIYTDGASTVATRNGGWAYDAYTTPGESLDPFVCHAGRVQDTTNNVMELYAIYEAIRLHPNHSLTIYSDSQNAICWISGTFKVKVKNAADYPRARLVSNIQDLIKKRTTTVTFVKVAGHDKDPRNNLVDEHAVAAKNNGPLHDLYGYDAEPPPLETIEGQILRTPEEKSSKWPDTILSQPSVPEHAITRGFRNILAQAMGPKKYLEQHPSRMPQYQVKRIGTSNVKNENVTYATLQNGVVLVHVGENVWTPSRSLTPIVHLNRQHIPMDMLFGMIYD